MQFFLKLFTLYNIFHNHVFLPKTHNRNFNVYTISLKPHEVAGGLYKTEHGNKNTARSPTSVKKFCFFSSRNNFKGPQVVRNESFINMFTRIAVFEKCKNVSKS